VNTDPETLKDNTESYLYDTYTESVHYLIITVHNASVSL